MRKPLLFRHFRAWVLTMLCLLSAQVFAQEQPAGSSKMPPYPISSVLVEGDFEAECLVPFEKRYFYNEDPNTVIACQGMTVEYTGYTDGVATSWEWEVVGADSYTVLPGHGDKISVTWGDGEGGQLIVTARNSWWDNVVTRIVNVRLIEKPHISVTAVPGLDANNIVYVCKGSSVDFVDNSSTENTDIVGYYWEGCHRTGSNSTFRVEEVLEDCDIVHRVYNNCGCYDEEVYHIKMLDGSPLEIKCYGTACEGLPVTYSASSPDCEQWWWYVTGGSIMSGQNSPEVTILWDDVHDGYGVLGIDGSICGNNACPSMMTKKIPVITRNLPIEGQTTACVGDAVIYSLPLFGSTEYTWSIWPTTGATPVEVNNASEQMYIFNQPGTYYIRVKYVCEFLGCGPFDAQQLIVTVKPKLAIEGNNRICISSACQLTTDAGVSATWKVEDIDNNNQIIYTTTGTDFSWVFPHVGKYKVIAENSNYCRPAEFIMMVVGAPSAPTASDLASSNPHKACPNSGVLLKGNMNNPRYSLVWMPTCEDATPEEISGNEVTINYGNTVCDIEVYMYDREIGCRSENAYVHTVSAIAPLPVNIPSPLSVCSGQKLVWGNAQVPNQEGFHYLWKIQDDKQYMASIQGNATTNGVTLAVNNETPNGLQLPSSSGFDVILERRYCDLVDTTIIHINVGIGLMKVPVIIPQNPTVCQGSSITFNGSSANLSSRYYWKTDESSTIYHTPSFTHTFRTYGDHTVTMLYNPYDVCDNPGRYLRSTTQAHVNPIPPYDELTYNSRTGKVEVVGANPGSGFTIFTFDWYFNGTQLSGHAWNVNFSGVGDYTCVVTNMLTGCSRTIDAFITNVPGPSCTQKGWNEISYDTCSGTLHLSSMITSSMVNWTIIGGHYTIEYGNASHSIVDITFKDAAKYRIYAKSASGPCQQGSYTITVPFIPNFTFERQCTKIVVNNNSKYQNANLNININVKRRVGTYYVNAGSIQMRAGDESATFNVSVSGTYVFQMTQPYNCNLGEVSISTTASDVLVVTATNGTAGPVITCDNTPLQLSAALVSGNPISSVRWSFNDGSNGTYFDEDLGNTFYHTFNNQSAEYTVTATVKDENGCDVVGNVNVKSFVNNLMPGVLVENPSARLCAGSSKSLTYKRGNTIPAGTYTWNIPNYNPTSATQSVSQTGTYIADVTNNHFCVGHAQRNVVFYSLPTAIIWGVRPNYCQGDNVDVHGATGPDSNNYTYDWSIVDPNGYSLPHLPNDATISFSASVVGQYTINLTVTSNQGCSSTAQPVTVQVYQKPIAPIIDYGVNACLDNPPVELKLISPAGVNLHWSNGSMGSTAHFYTPGPVTAWYYDQVSGCRSYEGNFSIDAQPDFDAVLTGCYEKCPEFFQNGPTLPVWGLTRWSQTLDYWEWFLEGNGLDNSTFNFTYAPIQLPLKDFGNYNLYVKYNGGNCDGWSPTLTINEKPNCDCENVEITFKGGYYVQDCHIYYDYDVIVCNNSQMHYCFKELNPLFDSEFIKIVSCNFSGLDLDPNDCAYFHILLEVSQFVPSQMALFELVNFCDPNCTVNFSIDLMPDISCVKDMDVLYIDPVYELNQQSDAATYFKFALDVPCENLIALWSDPDMIIHYDVYGSEVYGLGMVDNVTLSQIAQETGKFCFYAIVCEKDQLCKRVVCVPIEDLEKGMTYKGGPREADHANPIYRPESDIKLSPNPATDDVSVMGTSDEVTEVLVMDMNGRKMASFEGTSSFSVANLASGVYIVCVKTKADDDTPVKVTYLKLVKK